MKLYLSSYQLGDRPRELVRMAGGPGSRVAVILNAADFDADARTEKRHQQMDAIRSIGLIPEQLDLREYFGSPDNLRTRLRAVNALWVAGGNSFVLRRAMVASGFDAVARPLIASGRLTYAGYSAGACVAGPTLKALDLVDSVDEVPTGYEPGVHWEGLGLIEHSIAPHYQSDHPESKAIDDVVTYFEKNDMPFKALRDGEVLTMESPVVDLTARQPQ